MAKRIKTISLDPNSNVGRDLDNSLGEIIHNLRKLTTIEGRKLRQLVAELEAGKQYVKAPKATAAILDELLAKPMRQIKGPGFPMNVQKPAAEFLNWYQRLKAGRKTTRER